MPQWTTWPPIHGHVLKYVLFISIESKYIVILHVQRSHSVHCGAYLTAERGSSWTKHVPVVPVMNNSRFWENCIVWTFKKRNTYSHNITGRASGWDCAGLAVLVYNFHVTHVSVTGPFPSVQVVDYVWSLDVHESAKWLRSGQTYTAKNANDGSRLQNNNALLGILTGDSSVSRQHADAPILLNTSSASSFSYSSSEHSNG